MHNAKRGEPLPINQALNKSRLALGLPLNIWAIVVFITVVVFLAGFRAVAVLGFPMLAFAARQGIRNNPKMIELYGLSWSQKPYYDPRKH